MAQINGYKEELQDELQKTEPDSHASRLLAQEIERLEKGEDNKDRSVAFIDVHSDSPQNVGLKIRIPVQEFPRFNFVGKLLGPKGNTLKRLQEQTGCKMAILGKGSMRDRSKEEEMRKEGGKKYAHLNDALHVYVEAQAEMTDGYRRLAHAVAELKKFLVPNSAELDEGSMLDPWEGPSLGPPFPPLFPPLGGLGFPPPGRMNRPGPGGGPMGFPRGPMFPPLGALFPFQGPAIPFQKPAAKKPKKEQPKPEREHTPWYYSIKDEFHLLKRLRRRAERKWQKTKKPEDLEAYNAAKRKFNQLVAKAKIPFLPPKERKKRPDESTADAETGDKEKKSDTDLQEDEEGSDAGDSGTDDSGDETVEAEVGEKGEASASGEAGEAARQEESKMQYHGEVSESATVSEEARETDDCHEARDTEEAESGGGYDESRSLKETGEGDVYKAAAELEAFEDARGTEDMFEHSTDSVEENDDIRQQQMQEMMYLNNDAPRGGRGGFQGGPAAGRGVPGRGGPRGGPVRGSPRGGPRGGGPGRGGAAPRGSAPMRGAARGRGGGGMASAQSSSYDDYGYVDSRRGGGNSYEEGYDSGGYGDSSYGSGQGDDQYYGSSGRGQSSSASYDDYSEGYDYEGWGTNGTGGGGGPMKSSSRGGGRPRSHPYGGGRGGY